MYALNGKESINGSDLEVSEMSGLHTEYITAGKQLIPFLKNKNVGSL